MIRWLRQLWNHAKALGRRLVHGRVQRDVDRMAREVGVAIEHRSGTPHDAFSHAYVSARLTLRLGERIAYWIGALNERLGSEADGKHLEAEMDHHNNAVGRAIGVRQRRNRATSREETGRQVKAALDRRDLQIIERDGDGRNRIVPSHAGD